MGNEEESLINSPIDEDEDNKNNNIRIISWNVCSIKNTTFKEI